MSGSEAATLVKRIDDDILSNRQKLQEDFLEYFTSHVDELAKQIALTGKATVPTFAGNFVFTEEDIARALSQRLREGSK